jgi:pectate lyase
MKNIKALILSALLVSSGASAHPAFPDAEGGGAVTLGGRGGRAILVTTLADSGAGSLRECVMASGPRTCIFRVGGTITLQSMLYIQNAYLTVAGQTAPGGGIQLTTKGTAAAGLFGIATHDVIWQYTKLRNGWTAACSNADLSECGATGIIYSGGYNVILDHNSTSWNQDEGIGVWDGDAPKDRIKNVTMSYNIVAEGLASHSTGIITGGATAHAEQMTDIDMHHNLIINNSHRNPLAKHKTGRITNNIFYNQDFYVVQVGGGISIDVVSNIFKAGPLNKLAHHEVQGFYSPGGETSVGNPSMYLSGNTGWNQTNPAGDQWAMAATVAFENGPDDTWVQVVSGWKRATPLAATTYPITVTPVASLDAVMLPTVGASRSLDCYGNWVNTRDATDTRQVTQYLTNTGITALIANESEVGGFPSVAAGTPCADSDEDGMPNAYEEAHGLNANSKDGGARVDTNGYTYLENYINGH